MTSGEQITYAYDALNRLSQASAAGWGQSFTYDGFGNLTGKTATAGSSPYMSLSVDHTTNRTTSGGLSGVKYFSRSGILIVANHCLNVTCAYGLAARTVCFREPERRASYGRFPP